MSLQPGVPAFGAGMGEALTGDHPDDVEPDRGVLRAADGEPVGRSDRDADAEPPADAADAADAEPTAEHSDVHWLDEEALDDFAADRREESSG